VAAKKPIAHDVARIRGRLGRDPIRRAIGSTWRALDIESFLSHFVATSALAREIAEHDSGRVNTDDDNLVEYGFARTVGTEASLFSVDDIRQAARARRADRPQLTGGAVDWARVEDGVVDFYLAEANRPTWREGLPPERAHRLGALRALEAGNAQRALAEWRMQPREPIGPTQVLLLASALADAGDESALRYAEALNGFDATESAAVVARLRLRQGKWDEAAGALADFFVRLRADPWPMVRLVSAALDEARELVAADAEAAAPLYAALREPFALHLFDEERMRAALAAAQRLGGAACVEAFAAYEPNVRWEEPFLDDRLQCYRSAGDAREARAARDLAEYRSRSATPFASGLP
jgi:hypothetical protein